MDPPYAYGQARQDSSGSSPSAVPPIPNARKSEGFEKHANILAGIHMILGGLFSLISIRFLFQIFVHGFFARGISGESLYAFYMGLLALLPLGSFIGGFGLLRRYIWGKQILLVLGVIFLFIPPFGTALGVYTWWVLWDQKQVLFERASAR